MTPPNAFVPMIVDTTKSENGAESQQWKPYPPKYLSATEISASLLLWECALNAISTSRQNIQSNTLDFNSTAEPNVESLCILLPKPQRALFIMTGVGSPTHRQQAPAPDRDERRNRGVRQSRPEHWVL
jgi:hypothetical protein